MATQLLSGLAPEYIKLDIDSDKDNQTEYNIRPLNGMQYAQVVARCVFKDGYLCVTEDAIPLIIQFGLLGWKNMLDGEGNEVDFDRALVNNIPGTDLFALARKIFTKSTLAESEKKT